MPKKFTSENTKAVAARDRKKGAKEQANQKLEKEQEDAKWKDNDKQVLKKQQKKEADEKKKQEQLQRKAEAKALLEKEMDSLTTKPSTTKASTQQATTKVTRAQILQSKNEEKTTKKDNGKAVAESLTHVDVPLEENLNRLTIDYEEARNVDEAIQLLGGPAEEVVDHHPEKRMKAAYAAYETKRLPELKLEYPSLKLSQLKQMIFKEWQKSPENPINKNKSS